MNVLIWTAQSINLSTIKETERQTDRRMGTAGTDVPDGTDKTDNINVDIATRRVNESND